MAFFTVEFQAATNADWSDNFELRDEAGPVDITGAAFEMDIRDAGGAQLIELTTAAGTLPVLNAGQGVFGIAVPAAVMAGLAPGSYRLDCLMRQGGQTLRLFEGRLFLEKGITQ